MEEEPYDQERIEEISQGVDDSLYLEWLTEKLKEENK